MEQTRSLFKYSVKGDKTEGLKKLNSNKNSNNSSLDEIVNPSLSLYQKLKSSINHYEDLEFPPLQLPSMRIKPQRKKIGKKREKCVIEHKPSIVVVKFNTSACKNTAISGSLVYSKYRESLGPGKYENLRKGSMPGGAISQLPRFSDALAAAEDFIEARSNRGSSEFICKNLNLSPCYKDKKLEIIKENAKLREFEEHVHKKTKSNIEEMKKEVASKKYSEKMSKFEWRLRSTEIQYVKKSWGCLLIAFGFASGIKSLILNKISRNKRIIKNFRLLGWLCRFVGKIMLKLKKYRWKKLIKVIDKHSSYVKKWVGKKKALYKHLIFSIVDKALMGDYMTNLMRRFIKEIKTIQWHIRSILKIKRARNWGLSILFNKLEKQIGTPKGGKRTLKAKNSQFDIDFEVRKYYIHVAKEFTEKMKTFKQQQKAYEENLNKVVDEKTLMMSFEAMEAPKRPKFFLFSKQLHIIKKLKMAMGFELNQKPTTIKKNVTKSPQLKRQLAYK